MSLLDLRDEVAIVTGASRGIGLVIATTLQRAGARVIGLDLEISPELEAVSTLTFAADVKHPPGLAAIAAELDAAEVAPTILVNNAGIARDGVSWKLTDEAWDLVLAVNLKGAFNVARQWIPSLRAEGRGSIINISSINGLRGKFGQCNYAAAKAGLIGLTKSLAREVGAFNIRVNAIAPGMVATDLTLDLPEAIQAKAKEEALLPELATPQDIANAVLFLCSPLAARITGQVLQVDAGQYL